MKATKFYNTITDQWEEILATPTPSSLAPYAKVTDLTAETERAEAAEAAIIQSKWENVPDIVTNNGIKYGRLYNWYAATDLRKLVPNGWHVPSNEEWQTLIDFAGGSQNLVSELNTLNFNIFLGGSKEGNGNFYDLGVRFNGYSSTIDSNSSYTQLYELTIYGDSSPVVGELGIAVNSNGKSIRLVKDNNINEGDVIIDGDTYHAVTIGTQVWLQQNLAVRHYQNGDPILSDFSGTVGAVCAYNNDETNVYDIVATPDPTHIEPILSKMIYVNAVDFKSLVEYPDNATAISAGLTAGQLYTTTGSLKIVYSIAP